MNILSVPRSVVQFADWALRAAVSAGIELPTPVVRALAPFLATFALSGRRRNQSELGRFVVSESRHPSTVSRILQDTKFRSRDLLRAAWKEALSSLVPEDTSETVTFLLSIDASSQSRGAHTKIKGGQRYGKDRNEAPKRTKAGHRREAAKNPLLRLTALDPAARHAPAPTLATTEKKNGGDTKSFMMLFGMLTTHEGVRIPVTRYTCDPKKFRRRGRPRKHRDTQIDMAVLMIREVLAELPAHVRLVVVADSFYDSKKLFALARSKRGFTFIVPADKARCYGKVDDPTVSNRRRIHARGLKLGWDSFEEVVLHRGQEGTASYRRHAYRSGSGGHRTYWVHHESRAVAGLGVVGVVCSWKTPVFQPKKSYSKRTFKALLCSDPTMPAAQMVEFFEMRWTMSEIGFREWKQELGLGDYVGTELTAMERHVDLVLLSFLYLELNRLDVLEDRGAAEADRIRARYARTKGMRELVWSEVQRELWEKIEASTRSDRARRRLKRALADAAIMRSTLPCNG